VEAVRIGFITNGTEQDLQFAKENGFPCVEINIHNNLAEWEARKETYKEWLERYGIEVNAMGLWGRNFISPDESERERCFDELRRHIELASFFGAKVIMVGGGYNEGQPIKEQALRACELFPPYIELAESKGLKFAFYNCHWTNHITGPEAWDIVLDKLPTVGIKFDPSHPFYDGLDYLQHARDYGHRFYHIHAKGCVKIAGKPFDDPPAGMDQIDWRSLFAILYKHNYQGDINLEPHSPTWLGERYYKGLLFSKRFLEQFIL
jgi:sugar phosphate isomerase/epimerase